MKKIIAFVLICVMCLGITSCGASEEEKLYEKYEDIISALEKGKYDKAIEKINKLEEKEDKKDKEDDEDDVNGGFGGIIGGDLSDEEKANNMYAEIIGEWIPTINFAENYGEDVLTFRDDKTVTYEDVTYTTEVNYVFNEDSMSLLIKENDVAAFEFNIDRDSEGNLSASLYTHTDDGISEYMGDFYFSADYEKIELTADNFYDYFEVVEEIEQNKNDFDEVVSLSVRNNYVFKSEYGIVNESISKAVVEYSYTYDYYDIECDFENATYEVTGYHYDVPNNYGGTETASFETFNYDTGDYGTDLSYSYIGVDESYVTVYENFEILRALGTIYFSK